MSVFRLAVYLDDGLICGGAERVARRLLIHWVSLGWEVFLVARRPPVNGFFPLPVGVKGLALRENETVNGDSESDGAEVRRRLFALPGLGSLRSMARLGFEAVQLRRVLRRIDPDVTVAFLTPANVKLLLAAGGLRCSVIVSERSDTRYRKYPRMWIAWRRLLYPYADVVTANLAASIVDMARYVPEARLAHVPNPVEYPEDNELALPQHSRRIVSVGRLVPCKRHRMLIEMFGVLLDDLDGWELDIVGEGPMRSELEQQIQACGLGGRVHLHGQRHDVGAFYRAAAIFILPSSVEGTPNALLEAMAHALPCIVSDAVAGAKEYLEEGVSGYAFRADSSADLIDRMRSLVRAPEQREAIGQKARERIMAKSQDSAYTVWDRVIGLAKGSRPDRYAAS